MSTSQPASFLSPPQLPLRAVPKYRRVPLAVSKIDKTFKKIRENSQRKKLLLEDSGCWIVGPLRLLGEVTVRATRLRTLKLVSTVRPYNWKTRLVVLAFASSTSHLSFAYSKQCVSFFVFRIHADFLPQSTPGKLHIKRGRGLGATHPIVGQSVGCCSPKRRNQTRTITAIIATTAPIFQHWTDCPQNHRSQHLCLLCSHSHPPMLHLNSPLFPLLHRSYYFLLLVVTRFIVSWGEYSG